MTLRKIYNSARGWIIGKFPGIVQRRKQRGVKTLYLTKPGRNPNIRIASMRPDMIALSTLAAMRYMPRRKDYGQKKKEIEAWEWPKI